MGKSQDLWKKGKNLIPGGAQLLSKRAEMFLPEIWPAYFQSAKGVGVTDLDGKTYIDMSLMGIGACNLGYADPDVDEAVKRAIDRGSMCTLNSPEEVELAEELIKIHPWAGMVRYARSGGEAAAIAVRLGRAFSKKDKVAFCGYHGWHDWYLSSNLNNDKNLDGHLLPGLEPLGVPRGLVGTSLPFEYNNLKQLKKIVQENEIGVIIMEAFRHHEPKDNFLGEVRKIADQCGAVLIFDEISSGFRMNVGGVHLLYGVNPDIAVFGKAISNGFPMAAIIGKREIMDMAQTSFISSTYWTERVGSTAALATIKKMKEKNVPAHIDKMGHLIEDGWKKLAERHGLHISTIGPNAMITFSFNYENPNDLKTLFTQEMLKRGYLAGLSVYVSFAHTEAHLEKYLAAVDEVFAILKDASEKGDAAARLEGPPAHIGFKRLT